MDSLSIQEYTHLTSRHPTMRDILTPLFRHRRIVVLSFLGIFVGALLWTLLSPKQYQAQMKIVVKRERVNNELALSGSEVTEQEINSEFELLQSRDMLERVVVECGLDRRAPQSFVSRWFYRVTKAKTESEGGSDRKISEAAQTLSMELEVTPIKKTSLINVSYQATDPRLAAHVLDSVARQYLAKHVEVYRVPGAWTFFQNETERYKKELGQAETRLADFDEAEGVVAPQLEKQITLQKLADFDASLRSSQIEIDETQKRISRLEAQLATVPPRETTQIRTGDNALLLQQLKSTLLSLELKRTELVKNFTEDYRPVQEVAEEISHTQATIRAAETTPVREQTTDRDPIHEWLREELAKARTELDALRARSYATTQVVRAYQDRAHLIDKEGIVQERLVRDTKSAEDNYLLYMRKAEESRITDTLDQARIVNVAIAEAPTVPSVPSRPKLLLSMVLGTLLASFSSVGLAFASDYLDPSLRTPDELQRVLDLPVLAALPEKNR